MAKARILVAEDNSANQVLALAYLKGLGYSAQTVANGIEAVEAVSTGAFDLVLMDCQMPEMDGLEATRRIRSLSNENKDICIIALTANAMEEDRESCIKAGMNDFLSKPFSKTQLQEVLEKWLEKKDRLERHF